MCSADIRNVDHFFGTPNQVFEFPVRSHQTRTQQLLATILESSGSSSSRLQVLDLCSSRPSADIAGLSSTPWSIRLLFTFKDLPAALVPGMIFQTALVAAKRPWKSGGIESGNIIATHIPFLGHQPLCVVEEEAMIEPDCEALVFLIIIASSSTIDVTGPRPRRFCFDVHIYALWRRRQ